MNKNMNLTMKAYIEQMRAGDYSHKEDFGKDLLQLCKQCVRYLGDKVEDQFREDLAIEGCLSVWESLSTYDVNRDFCGWLTHIIRNAAKNFYGWTRFGGLETCLLLEETDEDINEDENEVLSAYEYEGCTEADIVSRLDIQNALALIPASYRKFLELKYFEDLTYQQMEERLGCSSSSFKNWGSRGLAAMKKVLGDDYIKKPSETEIELNK